MEGPTPPQAGPHRHQEIGSLYHPLAAQVVRQRPQLPIRVGQLNAGGPLEQLSQLVAIQLIPTDGEPVHRRRKQDVERHQRGQRGLGCPAVHAPLAAQHELAAGPARSGLGRSTRDRLPGRSRIAEHVRPMAGPADEHHRARRYRIQLSRRYSGIIDWIAWRPQLPAEPRQSDAGAEREEVPAGAELPPDSCETKPQYNLLTLPRPTSRPSKQQLLAEIRATGVADERVLDAVARVPRERFVPARLFDRAYENVALPIGQAQTISQPTVVAHMAQAAQLHEDDHVLEIGTGSGYGAAVLSELARDVVTVEIRPELAQRAAACLRELGWHRVTVVVGDGSLGWPDLAPYDAIVVTAAAPGLPPVLLEQLSPEGGRLVVPVGSLRSQELVVAERRGSSITSRNLGAVRFVPLVGAAGFRIPDPSRRN